MKGVGNNAAVVYPVTQRRQSYEGTTTHSLVRFGRSSSSSRGYHKIALDIGLTDPIISCNTLLLQHL